MEDGEEEVPLWAGRFPEPDMSAAEFEQFVAHLLRWGEPGVEGFQVTSHEKIKGTDGVYDFDATVRFAFHGLDFLVLVEAKRHANSIKRALVQELESKKLSVGAHKAVLVSTAPFQSGAIEFAAVHGIALVIVTEGRFTFLTRAATPTPTVSREEAAAYGMPTFVGVYLGAGETPDSQMRATLSGDDPETVQKLLFGISTGSPDAG